MTSTRQGLNGEIAFEAKDITVGYVPGESYGYKRDLRVTVTAEMEHLTRQAEYETVEHKHVTRPLDFSITTSVWRPDNKDSVAGGATVEPLAEITRYASGWNVAKVAALVKLAEWHLNGMTAACAHQTVVWEDGQYGRQRSLDLTPACPVTGYKYGSAWLVRELPEGFLDRVKALFGQS